MKQLEEMKTEEKFSNFPLGNTSRIDSDLKDLAKTELPESPENPWFTKKVMNRLPEQNPASRFGFLKIVCYCLAALAIVAGWALTCYNIATVGFTTSTVTALIALPMVTLYCAIAVALPIVRRELA